MKGRQGLVLIGLNLGLIAQARGGVVMPGGVELHGVEAVDEMVEARLEKIKSWVQQADLIVRGSAGDSEEGRILKVGEVLYGQYDQDLLRLPDTFPVVEMPRDGIWFLRGSQGQYRGLGVAPLEEEGLVREVLQAQLEGPAIVELSPIMPVSLSLASRDKFFQAAITVLKTQGPLPEGEWRPLATPALAMVFPTYQFYALRYDVLGAPPGPVRSENWLVAVHTPDQQVTKITTEEQLKAFFQRAATLDTTVKPSDHPDAAIPPRAWMELVRRINPSPYLDALDMSRGKFSYEVMESEPPQFRWTGVFPSQAGVAEGTYVVKMHLHYNLHITTENTVRLKRSTMPEGAPAIYPTPPPTKP